MTSIITEDGDEVSVSNRTLSFLGTDQHIIRLRLTEYDEEGRRGIVQSYLSAEEADALSEALRLAAHTARQGV